MQLWIRKFLLGMPALLTNSVHLRGMRRGAALDVAVGVEDNVGETAVSPPAFVFRERPFSFVRDAAGFECTEGENHIYS